MSRIMQVFYGNDCLPYKDKERQVHYPIVGNSFAGSSRYDQINFYVGDIGGANALSWVAIVKLPNGKILYQLLSNQEYDDVVGEYYLTFDISSYYTQAKGDLYISLNGCQGQVTITTDDETDISTISGEIDSRTVVATGAVKLSIYYAPQRPVGYSFELDQYQTIIDALGNKANVINTIQIVADISQESLGSYAIGQLFYSLADNLYYKKVATSPYYELADKGILGESKVLYRVAIDSSTTIEDLEDLTDNYTRLLVANYQSQDYLLGISKIGSIYALVIIMFNYGFNDPLVIFKGSTIDSTKTIVSFLTNTNKVVYVRQTNDAMKLYATNDVGGQTVVDYSVSALANNVVQRDGNAQVNVPQTPTDVNHATSKKYVDSLIATIKENAFILVDTTTYTTLDSFLASSGEEGYIYLYPIDNNDLTKGYYQYIWESNGWLDIGTTQIDLSDYYTKSQVDTIANGKVDKTSSASKVYGTNASGNQTTISFTSSNSGSTIPLRDNNGNIGVSLTPTNNTHATSKKYVDDLIDTKVDKTDTPEMLYGTDYSGHDAIYKVDSDLVGDGDVVRRNYGTGTIVTGNPTAVNHATTKKYVDDSVSNAISNVYKIKGSKTVAEINALTGMQVGDVYNVTDSGTITLGSLQVFTGDNIVWTGSAWDKLGAEIDWSAYDEKFMSAGFFEVQNYNESTGEITMVYATDLYDMSYNGDTGVLSIEAI